MPALRSNKKIARQINKRSSMVNAAVMCEVLERRQLLTGSATTTVITSSSASPVYGDPLTLTATVTGSAGTAPTGTVKFDKGATNLGTGTLGTANATAGTCTWTLTTTTLSAGTDSLVAVYSGDSADLASNSSSFSQTVTKATPSITFSNPSDITYGTPLSSTQLNATAAGSLPGTFSYNAPSGTILPAGSTEAIIATFTPTDSTDYSTATATADINVNTKTLTLTGIVANNKTYNGSSAAIMNVSHAALVGVVTGDATKVSLVTTGISGTFSGSNVGNGLTVTVSGLTLGGTKAADYTLTQPTATANISSLALTVTGITAATKVYDGGTTATINSSGATLVGVVSGDTITLVSNTATGAFTSSNVSSAAVVAISGMTLTGNTHSDYTLTEPDITTSITAKPITITGVTAADKTYDGTSTATLNTSSAALSGVVAADDSNVVLSTTHAAGVFASVNASSSAQTVTISGLTISGSAAFDYSLTQPTTTATISTKALTVSGIVANNKTYNGSSAAIMNVSHAALVGVAAGDAAKLTLVTSGIDGAFSGSDVGTGLTVTVSGLTLTGAKAADYTLTQPTATANISSLALTVTGITAATKVYDGGTTATINSSGATLVGVVSGDTITLVSNTATGAFTSSNVSSAAVVAISGMTLTGNTHSDYTLTEPDITTSITAKPITITGVTAADKTYDGTSTATLNTSSAALSGVVAADDSNVVLSTTHAAGVFASVNASSSAQTVTISGLTISGSAAFDYSLTQPTTTATISTKALTVSGIVANNKTYNGSSAAIMNVSHAALVGVAAGDAAKLTLVTSGIDGAFSGSDVGTGLTVTVSGLTLTGAKAAEYTLTQPTATANISSLALTVTGITAATKVYDGGTTATINSSGATLVGVVSGDTITLVSNTATGAFTSSNVSSAAVVAISGMTLTGNTHSDYTLTEPDITTSITAKPITVVGVTAVDKPYDGTTTATLNTSSAILSGVLSGDSSHVTLGTSTAVGAFASANASSSAQTVNITGLTLSGTDALDYSLTQPTTTAKIDTKALTVTGIVANNRAYNSSTGATMNSSHATLVGVVHGDTVGLVSTSLVGTFAAANVGTGVTVTTTGLSLNGSSAANYTVTDPSVTGNITPLALTVTGITAANKTFDGTTKSTLNTSGATLVGVLSGDTITLVKSAAVGTFATAAVSTAAKVTIGGLTLSGNTLGDYTLTAPTTTANITPKSLTVSGIAAVNKVYDGTTTGAVDVTSPELAGLLASDASKVSLVTTGAKGTFANASAGTGITVTITGLTLGGADSTDYTISADTTTANITAKPITITGITAANKTYNGSTAAVLTTTAARLVGVLTADSSAVTLSSGSAVGTFSGADAGTGLTVTVTGLSLGGADGGDYSITNPTATANITPATLTVSGLVGNNKVYNGSTNATLNVSGASLVGVVGSDSVTLVTSGSTAVFTNKSAGTSIPITVTGLTLGGAKASDYILTQPTTHANITPKTLTVSGIIAEDKVGDGTTAAVLDTEYAELAGLLAADSANVTLNTSGAVGTFASANTGTGIAVTITAVTLTGTAAGDYTLVVDPTTADIT